MGCKCKSNTGVMLNLECVSVSREFFDMSKNHGNTLERVWAKEKETFW